MKFYILKKDLKLLNSFDILIFFCSWNSSCLLITYDNTHDLSAFVLVQYFVPACCNFHSCAAVDCQVSHIH